eukprot:scaffold196267_cov32-Tisochrysis_lutea.AAC.1
MAHLGQIGVGPPVPSARVLRGRARAPRAPASLASGRRRQVPAKEATAFPAHALSGWRRGLPRRQAPPHPRRPSACKRSGNKRASTPPDQSWPQARIALLVIARAGRASGRSRCAHSPAALRVDRSVPKAQNKRSPGSRMMGRNRAPARGARSIPARARAGARHASAGATSQWPPGRSLCQHGPKGRITRGVDGSASRPAKSISTRGEVWLPHQHVRLAHLVDAQRLRDGRSFRFPRIGVQRSWHNRAYLMAHRVLRALQRPCRRRKHPALGLQASSGAVASARRRLRCGGARTAVLAVSVTLRAVQVAQRDLELRANTQVADAVPLPPMPHVHLPHAMCIEFARMRGHIPLVEISDKRRCVSRGCPLAEYPARLCGVEAKVVEPVFSHEAVERAFTHLDSA